MCASVHVCAGAHRGQKRMLASLELELQGVRTVVSHPMRMLGIKVWSSARAARASNYGSPAPSIANFTVHTRQ